MSNRFNQAYVNAYRNAQRAGSHNALRRGRIRVSNEIEALTDALRLAQTAVEEERNTWNTWASGTGCVIGAILGSSGGPPGMLSGCTLGSNVLSTGVDYAYDSLSETELQAQLQIKEAELKDYDVELSDWAKKYPEYGAIVWEEKV